MSNKTSNETIFCNDFKILKKGSTFRATFFQHVGRTQSLCSPQSNESFGFEGNLKNEKVENNKVDFGEESEPIMTNINYTRKIITPPPGFDDIQPFITRNQEINEQNYEMPKSFSMAKRNLLLKAHTTHQSDGDLSQYINPDLLLGRRSSLLQNDQMNKKIRQKEAYKTAMCQAWLQGQNCAFGEQCSFAHGETDLQPLPANRQNPKYKTRVCENYTTTGICPFGNRCFFIHPQPNSKIEDVIEYKESLDQRTRELEGEALIQQDLASIKNQITRKSTNKKLKRFRKLESCGNFFTQFQLQQQAQLQQQIQIESQAIITATVLAQTAKTLETKAIELEIQKQQIQQQQQLNNYENVQTNSSANSNFGFFSKGMPNRFAALKNSSMTGSMPLIYSSNSNLYKHPNSIERRSKAVDSAILFSNSKHQFLQNEEISKGYDEPTLSDHDSSGPHTPPNFYQNPVVVPKCCRGNQWGSLTSSHNKKHESTFWSIDSPRMKNNHQNQTTTDIKFNKATISKFADDHDCSSLDNSTLYGSSLPTTKSLLNSAIDSSLLTQMTSNKGSLGTNLEKIWTSSLPEIDQNSNDNNEKTEKIENEEKVENEINSININESKEELEGSITTLFYSDIVKKTKKHEQLNEIVGQQIEIIGIPYLNNNNNNHLNKPGEQTWAMRAIKKSCLGNKFSSSPSLSPSTSLNSGEQNAHNTE